MKQLDWGKAFRALREKYGLSQRQLAIDLGYSIATISRIENGKLIPPFSVIEHALQRLGEDSQDYIAFFLDGDEKHGYQTIQKLRHLIVEEDYEEIRKVVAEAEGQAAFASGLYLQYIAFCKAVSDGSITEQERLDLLLDVIRMTQKAFPESAPYFLSHNEITIIGKIASTYHRLGEHEKAVQIMYGVKESMDVFYNDEWEKSQTYPMVLYNLAVYLGALERNKEAQEICIEAKKHAIKYNTMRCLPNIIAYMAHNYFLEEDYSRFKEYFIEAYYTARAMGQHRLANHMIHVATDRYKGHLDGIPFVT
ncbi:MAG: helix-turn-helix transcriptional regulator [Oscillospiraceae bacterium]|nr:helix-turn-helix transcriptional regulator [Oscillospiraceae bacterium]